MSGKYYAVHRGRNIGVFTDWKTTESQVKSYSGAVYKSFANYQDAINFVNFGPSHNLSSHSLQSQPLHQSSILSRDKLSNIVPQSSLSPTLSPTPLVATTECDTATLSSTGLSLQNSTPLILVSNNQNDNNDDIIIYTDGSYVNGYGGYGYLVLQGNDPNSKILYEKSGPVNEYPATNNIAELTAVKNSLQYIINANIFDKNITFYCDSKYVIGCLSEWYYSWVKNGWKTAKGSPVENKQLIQDCLNYIDTLRKCSCKIQFKHVYAHKGQQYNERVDSLANQGRANYKT